MVVTPVMLPEPTEVQEFDEVSEREHTEAQENKDDIYQRVKECWGSENDRFY